MKRVIPAALVLFLAAPAFALPALPGLDRKAEPTADNKLSVRAVPSHLEVAPGETFQVALDMRIAEGWWYYSQDPGDNGVVKVLPATLEPNVAPLQVAAVLWPPHKRHEARLDKDLLVNNVYEGRAAAFVTVRVPEGAQAGPVTLAFALDGQVCDPDHCIQVGIPDPFVVTAEVKIAPKSQPNPAWNAGMEAALKQARTAASRPAGPSAQSRPAAGGGAAGADYTLWAGLGLALLAGLMINIMPCVLPIIPLRIYSLVQMASGTRRRYVTLGLAFAGGVMLFFVGLAAANLILRLAFGESLDWSRHLGIPGVRIALVMVLVAIAMFFFGLFNVIVPNRIVALEGRPRAPGHLAAVGMGLMMAILGTPCSFGYLLAVLAWAQGQNEVVGTLAFLFLGVGMAAPHALLAAFPKLVEKLPRPGRWMEIFKQSTGFVLIGVAIWLLSTVEHVGWVAGYATVVAFALWMWGSWVRFDAPLGRRLLIRGLAVALAVGGGFWMLQPPPQPLVHFEPYSEAAVASATSQGRTVLVKFTAEWCLACIEQERTIFREREVADEIERLNVLPLKADVTNPGPASKVLYGRLKKAVPLTVIYTPGGGAPTLLEGEYAKKELLDALRAAAR